MNIVKMNTNILGKALVIAGLGASLGLSVAHAAGAPMAPEQPAGSRIMETQHDSAISRHVEARLMRQPSLKDSDIQVITSNGVVSLSGTVASAHAQYVAVNCVKSISGVRMVNSRLTIAVPGHPGEKQTMMSKSGEAISDSWITTKVKSQILTDRQVKNDRIGVTTQDGLVTLAGTVNSQQVLTHLIKLTLNVNGVKSVETSGLVISTP
jgi:hyperosmotically inducible protein